MPFRTSNNHFQKYIKKKRDLYLDYRLRHHKIKTEESSFEDAVSQKMNILDSAYSLVVIQRFLCL